jgi:hypothetical protein
MPNQGIVTIGDERPFKLKESKEYSPISESLWPDLILQLARIGYEAYGNSCHWNTFDGCQMPTWEGIGVEVQRRWQASAAAILSAYQGNVTHTFSEWRTDVLQVLNDLSAK